MKCFYGNFKILLYLQAIYKTKKQGHYHYNATFLLIAL